MKFIIATLLLASSAANASYKLVNNGKTINCYADDNQSWMINKARTKIKYTIEGESLGALKIEHTDTDDETYVTYITEVGTLTLNEDGATFMFAEEEEPWEITCE